MFCPYACFATTLFHCNLFRLLYYRVRDHLYMYIQVHCTMYVFKFDTRQPLSTVIRIVGWSTVTMYDIIFLS